MTEVPLHLGSCRQSCKDAGKPATSLWPAGRDVGHSALKHAVWPCSCQFEKYLALQCVCALLAEVIEVGRKSNCGIVGFAGLWRRVGLFASRLL